MRHRKKKDYTYLATSAGEYTATVTDKNGCKSSDSVTLTDSCGTTTITIPNVFIPSRITDPLKPIEDPREILALVKIIDFTVFNRWGIVMFHSEGMLPNWDGYDMNQHKHCPTGVYFWILNYKDLNDNLLHQNGFTELIGPK